MNFGCTAAGSSLAPVLHGSVRFFSSGLVFLSSSIPPFILDFETQVHSITQHDMKDASTTRVAYPDIGKKSVQEETDLPWKHMVATMIIITACLHSPLINSQF